MEVVPAVNGCSKGFCRGAGGGGGPKTGPSEAPDDAITVYGSDGDIAADTVLEASRTTGRGDEKTRSRWLLVSKFISRNHDVTVLRRGELLPEVEKPILTSSFSEHT
jgi:hypothetical protein